MAQLAASQTRREQSAQGARLLASRPMPASRLPASARGQGKAVAVAGASGKQLHVAQGQASQQQGKQPK